MRWMACSVLILAAAAPTEAQFEIEAGPMYGVQDPERAVTPGWGVAGTFEIGGLTLVVEGAWHRRTMTREFPDVLWGWDPEDPFGESEPMEGLVRHVSRTRYALVTAGLRAGGRKGRRLGLYYQVLIGGFSGRFRTDYEYPEEWDVEMVNSTCGGYVDGELVLPCTNPPYPAFDEERVAAVVVIPGLGIEAGVWGQIGMRFGADFPIFASANYVVSRPRLTARVVVGF